MSTRVSLPAFRLPLGEDLPPEGSLLTTPAYVVLLWAAQRKFTGRLVFSRENRKKELLLREGRVAAIRSNLLPEGIDAVLARRWLSPAEAVALQAEVLGHSPVDYERACLDHLRRSGRLPADELAAVLALQIEERLLNLLGWFDGTYRLETIAPPPEDADAPSLADLLERVESWISGEGADFVAADRDPPPPTHHLRTLGGAALLATFGRHRANGELTIERGQRRKMIRLEEGRPASVSSTDPSETLGAVLSRWRFLPADVVQRIESAARSQGIRLRELLLRERILPEGELTDAMATLHAERVLEAFSWRSGKYEFRGSLAPHAAPRIVFRRPGTRAEPEEITSPEADPVLPELFRSLFRLSESFPGSHLGIVSLDRTPPSADFLRALRSAWTELGNGCRFLWLSPLPSRRAVPAEFCDRWIPMAELQAHRDLEPAEKRSCVWFAVGTPAARALVTSLGNTVLLVRGGRTRRRAVQRFLAGTPPGAIKGFLFIESPRIPRSASLFDALRSRLPRRPRP